MELDKEYYKNGNLKTESEVNELGIWHGICQFYHPNGQLKAKFKYIDGVQADGEVISYDCYGSIARSSYISNGYYNGIIQEWWSNGNIKSSLNYVDDEPFGELIEWDYFGKEISRIPFKDLVPFMIDSKNKVNYRVLKESFNPSIIFSDFIHELDEDWLSPKMSTYYTLYKSFDSDLLAYEYIKFLIQKYSFTNEAATDIEFWFRGDFGIFQKGTNVALFSSSYFDSREVKWGENEYCKKYIDINWIQGIGLIYSYQEKLEHELPETHWHIPYYGILANGGENITIYCLSKLIAEYFADQVILNNGGFDSFRTIQHLDLWKELEYVYAGPLFVIYVEDSNVIINRIESSIKRVDGSESLKGISKYNNVINNDIKGLRRLIYNEGEGMVQDGRFWISEDNSYVSSWWEDNMKAAQKFIEIIRCFDPLHEYLELSNYELVRRAKMLDFLSFDYPQYEITGNYRIGLVYGDNFMHLRINIIKELD